MNSCQRRKQLATVHGCLVWGLVTRKRRGRRSGARKEKKKRYRLGSTGMQEPFNVVYRNAVRYDDVKSVGRDLKMEKDVTK